MNGEQLGQLLDDISKNNISSEDLESKVNLIISDLGSQRDSQNMALQDLRNEYVSIEQETIDENFRSNEYFLKLVQDNQEDLVNVVVEYLRKCFKQNLASYFNQTDSKNLSKAINDFRILYAEKMNILKEQKVSVDFKVTELVNKIEALTQTVQKDLLNFSKKIKEFKKIQNQSVKSLTQAINDLIQNQRLEVSKNNVDKIQTLVKALKIVAEKNNIDISNYMNELLENAINDVSNSRNNMNRVVLLKAFLQNDQQGFQKLKSSAQRIFQAPVNSYRSSLMELFKRDQDKIFNFEQPSDWVNVMHALSYDLIEFPEMQQQIIVDNLEKFFELRISEEKLEDVNKMVESKDDLITTYNKDLEYTTANLVSQYFAQPKQISLNEYINSQMHGETTPIKPYLNIFQILLINSQGGKNEDFKLLTNEEATQYDFAKMIAEDNEKFNQVLQKILKNKSMPSSFNSKDLSAFENKQDTHVEDQFVMDDESNNVIQVLYGELDDDLKKVVSQLKRQSDIASITKNVRETEDYIIQDVYVTIERADSPCSKEMNY